MDSPTLLRLLKQLEIPELTIDYCVIGSAALMLAGIPLATCDDLDILTTRDGAEALSQRWAPALDATAHPHGHGLFRSHFRRFRFAQGVVEVMGDLEIRQPDWQPVTVAETMVMHGVRIPTLAEQQRLLALFGRPKDHDRLALLPPSSHPKT